MTFAAFEGMRHHHALPDVHAIVWHFKPNGAGTRQRQARGQMNEILPKTVSEEYPGRRHALVDVGRQVTHFGLTFLETTDALYKRVRAI